MNSGRSSLLFTILTTSRVNARWVDSELASSVWNAIYMLDKTSHRWSPIYLYKNLIYYVRWDTHVIYIYCITFTDLYQND